MTDTVLHIGDCRDVMATMEADSIDSIVTDPPYGISFMSRDWDHGVPGEVFWREALRVAKPGAYLLAFGGTRTYHRLACAIEDAGWDVRDCIMWVYGTGFPKSHNISKAIAREDNAATDAAKQWDGWGTALKPAYEPIIVARKPFTGTVAANVLRHGTGGLNIDGCRVEGNMTGAHYGGAQISDSTVFKGLCGKVYKTTEAPGGRWPANFVHDGSEEVTRLFPETKGEAARVIRVNARKGYSKGADLAHTTQTHADNGGGASRYFYTAKASPTDRGEGLATAKNIHPTVKPTSLMQWLVRLVTPPGGMILDPFMGSGSTGKAAKLEGFNFTGIDLSAEYHAIAAARIAHVEAEHIATVEDAQPEMFPHE